MTVPIGYRMAWVPSDVTPVKKSVDVDPVAAVVSILKAAGLVRKDWSEDTHPRGIPVIIQVGEYDHHRPYPGDGGVQFEEHTP